MGYRELFLVLLSSVLLTLLMTQINSNAVQGSESLQELALQRAAASVAQQFIEEAKSKRFDELANVIPTSSMPSGFTPWDALGPGSEPYPNFDDVDDYHGLSRTVYVDGKSFAPSSTTGIPFTVGIVVNYVSEANPDSAVSTETYLKRMTVTVTSNYFPGSLTAKHVFSYFGVNF